MADRQSVPELTSSYDGFLFAPICVEQNGMQLSVLSALTRMNLDPWQEANRLALMPKVVAEQKLVSTLDLIPDRNWSASEIQLIAERLIRLLPKPVVGGIAQPTQNSMLGQHMSNFWLVWIYFAIAMSFFSPHHHAAAVNSAAPSSKSSSVNSSSEIKNTLPPHEGNDISPQKITP